jgi:predicted dienelactone hydrolase
MIRFSLIAVLTVSLMASLAVAEPASHGMATPTELHAIDTLTLSDAQFLSAGANGKATVTTGQLRIASGTGRLPVVVLQHGSAGMSANIEMWARELNGMGISTFASMGSLSDVSSDTS